MVTRLLAATLALSLLAASGPVPAVEPARGVQAPAQIDLTAGGMPQVVTIENAAKVPVAVVNTTPALGFWQIVSPSPGKLSFLAFSQTPGTYEVCFLVNGATATEPPAETARTRIVVSGNVPPVPVPPGPAPVPPTPDDPFYSVLAGIYGGDQLATKADAARKLSAVYSQCAAGPVDDERLKTSADLFGVLSVAGKSMVPLPALQAVRERIAQELNDKLGTESATPLTAEYRAKAKAQFIRMAGILKKLAG